MLMNNARTVIMAGGKGSRLLPYTTVFPKPLMPVGDVPILDLVLRQLSRAGAKTITIALGHLAELIMAYCADGSQYGVHINYVRERQPLGTIGALTLVEPGSQTLLVLNGDVLTNLDFDDLVAYHRRSGALATIATYRRMMTVDKGVVAINDAGRILTFQEKPTEYKLVAMGIYAFEPGVYRFLRSGERMDAPELIQAILGAGEHVQSYPFDGYWLDIGVPADYQQALLDFSERGEDLLLKSHRAIMASYANSL